MKTKMASVFLALTLALGMFGFAAAYWSENLWITGTVTTGTFGWVWTCQGCGTSGDPKGVIVFPKPTISDDGKVLSFSASNVYPSTDIWIILDLHYVGSVPGHLVSWGWADGYIQDYVDAYVEIISITPDLDDQTDYLTPGAVVTWGILSAELQSTQWHESDMIKWKLTVHFVEEGMTYHAAFPLPERPVPDGVEVPEDTTVDLGVIILGKQYNAPV